MTKLLEVNFLSKQFNHQAIIEDLSFTLYRGEIISIVGPSASGKTTLLRILSGLEQPSSGSIRMEGKDISKIKANKRNISLVFQQSLLFPHMTVEENVSYGAKLANKKRNEKIFQLLDAIGMKEFKNYYPSEISGGQQQRVALARAIATEPEVILFDEPFSHLDLRLRKELRTWVRKFLVERNMTAIFVTHDTEEAMLLGNRVAIFHEGTFQQFDENETLYKKPKSPFVANFIGGHLVLDKTHFVPFSSCHLLKPENSGPYKCYGATLQHVTYQHGQKIGHLFVKELNQNLSLPVKDIELEGGLKIYIPKQSIQSFSLNYTGSLYRS
ncbi:ABC transporter ATP-binding protein [Halobacillus litoralis]|uniref:ABC transporter ATP-binding protein n=1 Tax=Halobacillus litoralis TaxID=45668 RepID=UPI0024904F9D|nr:ABC transporter ATP-binding protein [Halobacillus litoralis]